MRAFRNVAVAITMMSGFIAAEPAVPAVSDSMVAAQATLWDYKRFIIIDWCSGACEGGLCCQLVVQ